MKHHELERRTLEIAECVKRGQRIEDSAVELKREWISPERFARRLAAHANAARGEDVLWIIGLDEKEGVVGTDDTELADHIAAIRACFDGPFPALILDAAPRVDDKALRALLFSTARAPYLVKNPAHGTEGGGNIAREVPWREGTATRSATHEDLIRILSPLAALPEFEVLGGSLFIVKTSLEGQQTFEARLDLYVDSDRDINIVIPFHRCDAAVTFPGLNPVPSHRVHIAPRLAGLMRTLDRPNPPSQSLSPAFAVTEDEVFVSGPGKLILRSWHRLDEKAFQLIGKADGDFTATLRARRAERPLAVSARFAHTGSAPPTWLSTGLEEVNK